MWRYETFDFRKIETLYSTLLYTCAASIRYGEGPRESRKITIFPTEMVIWKKAIGKSAQ